MVPVADCAFAFEKLLKFQYEFHLAHKRKVHLLNLTFDPSKFFHLAGLHKLLDINHLKRTRREEVFISILIKTDDMEKLFQKSAFYSDLQTRLVPFLHLEQLLVSDNLVFRYSRNNFPYSKIQADYIIKGRIEDSETFVFLVNNLECARCCSIFQKEKMDYTKQQQKFTVLLKRKFDKSKNNIVYEYRHPNYQDQIG